MLLIKQSAISATKSLADKKPLARPTVRRGLSEPSGDYHELDYCYFSRDSDVIYCNGFVGSVIYAEIQFYINNIYFIMVWALCVTQNNCKFRPVICIYIDRIGKVNGFVWSSINSTFKYSRLFHIK